MITSTSLTHPSTRRAIVRSMLAAAAWASPGRRGLACVVRTNGHALATVRCDHVAATSWLPEGLAFNFYAGNRLLNDQVADALGYDLLNWTTRLAERLASPATVKHWS